MADYGTGRRAGRGPGSAGAFAPIVEAAESIAARFSDPSAMEGVNALESAADAVAALAQACNRVGQTTADAVYYDPRVMPYFTDLGSFIAKAEAPTREGARAVRAVHADDIERVQDGSARRRRWDISAHD